METYFEEEKWKENMFEKAIIIISVVCMHNIPGNQILQTSAKINFWKANIHVLMGQTGSLLILINLCIFHLFWEVERLRYMDVCVCVLYLMV